MVHNIKVCQSFAESVLKEDKAFDVRINDCGYQKGDYVNFIVLCDSDGREMVDHPLMKKHYEIAYTMSGLGYCVMELNLCADGRRTE